MARVTASRFVAEVDVHFPDAINRLLMAQVLFEVGEPQETADELHRLRELLGDEKAIQVQGGQVTIDPRYCCTDMRTFEWISAQVETLCHTSPPSPPNLNPKRIPGQKQASNRKAQAKQLIGKAKKQYQGEFLPGDSGHGWVISRRERLKSTVNKLIILQKTF
ncbi:MAG: malT [Candidatus Brocadiaceae bacterium]|nr:malT [Candidatus Brocadiaceae bacterium]